MMHFRHLAWFAIPGLALIQTEQSIFEPADFDVAAALGSYGVDVSAIGSLDWSEGWSVETGCRSACRVLSSVSDPDRVLAQNTPAYDNFTGSFWSVQQEEVNPHCVFKPATNKDVAVAVLLSRFTGCPFAAKSGGHAAFAGASNSPGGITIWFKDLNEVTLSEDKSIASVGPGNVWGQVYKALEPYGLATLGGRASDIGVGGLTTGGGISYYSNMYGWVLDNVESFEVVTASGKIVIASESEYSDLYWALRGGGNNLGLVTKFNLYTIPSPKMRSGGRIFTQDHFGDVLNAFVEIVHEAKNDPYAQYYIAFFSEAGVNLSLAELTYTKDIADPAIFEPFRSIPAVSDTTASKTLSEQCEEIRALNPNGLREVYWTVSVLLNEKFAKWAVQLFYSMLPQVSGLKGANPVLIYQAVTEPMLANMSKAGGNTLGQDPSKEPVHLMHISSWWENASDDETMYKFVHDFFDAVTTEAKEKGVYNRWIYMNYASEFQDVIASYGDENKARLQSIANKYDPHGVYQTLQPGYFKLNGAPTVYPY